MVRDLIFGTHLSSQTEWMQREYMNLLFLHAKVKKMESNFKRRDRKEQLQKDGEVLSEDKYVAQVYDD